MVLHHPAPTLGALYSLMPHIFPPKSTGENWDANYICGKWLPLDLEIWEAGSINATALGATKFPDLWKSPFPNRKGTVCGVGA